ncbi:uncharacterized protein DNG_08713 [Cephalotrichum gorgonifer]|uniref:WW domain-containing protein n=1 Tax=Cephalotrichum gorgonifer TaxID=2041049 RepID=A0AAE8N5K0_9PEZI|nr:uncharacterized protein DNG_08713 [Cephalotrichum gorgonifer]
MNNNIPPGWDLDYDGNRWFYRFRSSGIIQYTFPKDGDEFPDFVDASAPVPVLAPEERLESQQQIRRRGITGDGNGRTQSKTKPSEMGATGGPVSTEWEDDGGDDEYFQPENFMYLGPGAYTDVSPLAGGEEADDSAVSTKEKDAGLSATPDAVPMASPLVSAISTPQIPKGTPVTPQAEPVVEAPLSPIATPPETTVESIAPVASVAPAASVAPVASVASVAPIASVAAVVPLAPASPVADKSGGHTSPEVPMLDNRELPHELPEAPRFDPVGLVAEMPTDMTAKAHIELHPEPVEMGDNAVLAPIETFYINSGLAELPAQSSPTERKKEAEPPPPRRRAYSTPRVYPFQPTEDDDPNRPPTPLGGIPRPTPSPQAPAEVVSPDRSASFSPFTPSTASTPGDTPPVLPNATAVSPPEGAGPSPQPRKPTPQGVFKIARKPTNAGSKPGFKPWTPGTTPPKPSPDSSDVRDVVRSSTPSAVVEPSILPTEPKGQGQPHHQPNTASVSTPPTAPASIPVSGSGTARTSPPLNPTQHLLSQAPGPTAQPGDVSPPVPPKDKQPTSPPTTTGHLAGTTTPPVLIPGTIPQQRQGRAETPPKEVLPNPIEPQNPALTTMQDSSAGKSGGQAPAPTAARHTPGTTGTHPQDLWGEVTVLNSKPRQPRSSSTRSVPRALTFHLNRVIQVAMLYSSRDSRVQQITGFPCHKNNWRVQCKARDKGTCVLSQRALCRMELLTLPRSRPGDRNLAGFKRPNRLQRDSGWRPGLSRRNKSPRLADHNRQPLNLNKLRPNRPKRYLCTIFPPQQMPTQGFNGLPNAQPLVGPGMYAQSPMQVPAGAPATRSVGPSSPQAASTQEKGKAKWFSKFLKSSSSKTLQKPSPQQQQQIWQGPNGLFIPPSQSPGPNAPWSPGSFATASPFKPPSGPPPQGYASPQPGMQPQAQQSVPPPGHPSMNPTQMRQRQLSGGAQMAPLNMAQWGPPPAAANPINVRPPQAVSANPGHPGPQAPAAPSRANVAAQSTQKPTQAAENVSPQQSQRSSPHTSPPNPQHAKPTPDSALDGPARTESVRSDISFAHISEAQAQPVLRPQIVQVLGPAGMQMAPQPQLQLQKNGLAPQGHAPPGVAPQMLYGPGPQVLPGPGHHGQPSPTNYDDLRRLAPPPLHKRLSGQMVGAGPSSSARESMVSDVSSADSLDSRRVSVMSTGPPVTRNKLVKTAEYSGSGWGR